MYSYRVKYKGMQSNSFPPGMESMILLSLITWGAVALNSHLRQRGQKSSTSEINGGKNPRMEGLWKVKKALESSVLKWLWRKEESTILGNYSWQYLALQNLFRYRFLIVFNSYSRCRFMGQLHTNQSLSSFPATATLILPLPCCTGCIGEGDSMSGMERSYVLLVLNW